MLLLTQVRSGVRGGGGTYVIHNALEFLYISEYTNPDRVRLFSVSTCRTSQLQGRAEH